MTTDHLIVTRLGKLRVRVTRGDGDPILMWPSLLMDHSLWDAQVAHFAPRHTTIAVDPPGHGQSSRLASTFTLEDCATCVVEILDDLGFERAHFLGNSWGAMTGATFAARHPDRVLCGILMNGTASPASTRQKIEYTILVSVARVLRGLRPPLTRAVVDGFLGPTSLRTRPEVVARVLELARKNDVVSAARAVRSVVSLRPDQREILGAIRTPTLVIAGREDATFPLAEVEEMASCIPDADFVVIEDAAHLVALEVPEIVNAEIESFLARHA